MSRRQIPIIITPQSFSFSFSSSCTGISVFVGRADWKQIRQFPEQQGLFGRLSKALERAVELP